MNKNPKRKVIFDTSFLIRSNENASDNKGQNIIDAEFPSNDWDRIIHDYVIDEFFRLKEKRPERAGFYKKTKLYTMNSSHKIILEEFRQGTAESCLNRDERFESNLQPFLEKKHYAQINLKEKYDQQKKLQDEGHKKVFDILGINFNKNTPLSYSLLKDSLHQLISNGYQMTFHSKESETIYMKGTSFELIYPLGNKEILKRKILDVEKELPSLYQFLLLEEFIKGLKKPENKTEFKVPLPGLKSHLKIEFNTLADSTISLSGLHYCDAFATFDKGQAQIIKFLFPQYANKIRFYKIGYDHINVEDL